MEVLHYPIGLRVVSCGGGCGDAQQPVKRSPKVGSELRPTVGGEVVRDAEPCDPVADESSDTRLCRRVCHRNCLRPACEAVHDCEEVDLVLRGREGANDVDMDTAEASVWRRPFNKRGMDVALDLRSLASMAFLTPAANVTLESMPDEAGGDGSLCWLASRMRETVDGFKDSSGPHRWKDRSVTKKIVRPRKIILGQKVAMKFAPINVRPFQILSREGSHHDGGVQKAVACPSGCETSKWIASECAEKILWSRHVCT